MQTLENVILNNNIPKDNNSLAFSQFKSKKLEHSFRQHTLADDKKRGLILILAAIIFFALNFFLDYYFFGVSEDFLKMATVRGLSVLICFSVLILTFKTQNENHFDFFLFIFSILCCLAHLYISYLRPSGYIPVAIFNIIIIMIVYLVLPTRLIYKIIPCLMISVLSPSIWAMETLHEFTSLILSHLTSHLVGILFSNILNKSRRVQYSLFLNETRLKKNLEKSEKTILFISERLSKQNKNLKEFANRDQLTGIYNRRSLYEFAEEQWSRAVRNKEEFVIVMLDIDHFKDVNDTHGHQVGDIVLKGMAGVIDKLNRDYDRLGRWGGEEFMLFLPGANIEQGIKIAERLRREVADAQFRIEDDLDINITISLGIASKLLSNTIELDELIDHADKALYNAKKEGRNRACVFKKSS